MVCFVLDWAAWYTATVVVQKIPKQTKCFPNMLHLESTIVLQRHLFPDRGMYFPT